MLDGWMRLASRNQGLGGNIFYSCRPNAVALAQCAQPRAACTIGAFTSNVELKSGAPAFGTPK